MPDGFKFNLLMEDVILWPVCLYSFIVNKISNSYFQKKSRTRKVAHNKYVNELMNLFTIKSREQSSAHVAK